jgi:hypothetical protein
MPEQHRQQGWQQLCVQHLVLPCALTVGALPGLTISLAAPASGNTASQVTDVKIQLECDSDGDDNRLAI